VQPRQTPHTFNVTVTDPFGSSGSASWSWTVYAPPTVAITSGPAEGSITDSTSAAFTYTSSSPVGLQLTTTCTSDGTVTQCGSSSAMVTGLQPSAAMEHSFVVTVTDSTGGHASASRNWFVYYDTVTTPAPVAFGVPLSATLTAPTQTPTTAVANQVIKFIAGQNNPNGTVICTATTNSSGKATCGTLGPTVTALGAGGVTAVFSGNPPYLPSQGSAGLA
jgi:hypothetical protein